MKRTSLFLSVLMTALLVPSSIVAETSIFFTFVSGNDTVTNWNSTPHVYIYSKGLQIAESQYMWDFRGTYTLTLDDSFNGKTVSYMSSIGHRGSFTVQDSAQVLLPLSKLKVVTKHNDGTPYPWQDVTIRNESGNRYYAYPNDEGVDSLFLTSNQNFTYNWNGLSGSFYLTDDYTLVLTEPGAATQPSDKVKIRAQGRYGDFPYNENSYYYIYPYGDFEDYNYLYNGYQTEIATGSYWIRNDMGVFSDEIVINSDTLLWFDYHKVTVCAKTGTTPNQNQQVEVGLKPDQSNNNYSWQYQTTNANGEVVFYLMPGEYIYSIAGGQGTFTVTDQDMTVNVNTSKVVITLDCDDPAELEKQSFLWVLEDNNRYNSQTVTPQDGKISLTVMPGKYKLVINDICSVDVDVAQGENSKTIKLYSLKFTSNINLSNSIYLNSNRLTFNRKYYFTAGTYHYGYSYYSNSTEFELSENKEIAINYCTLTVTVKDSKGLVAGEYVRFGDYSGHTDENGKVQFQVMYGDYELSAPHSYVSKTLTLSQNEMEETFIIPDNVSFSVTHEGSTINNGGIDISEVDGDRYYYLEIEDGIAKARLDPTKKYEIHGYHGTTAITEGCTVQLGTLSVTSQGMGIAFPMENWEAISTYYVLVGSTVRLTAIPVGGQSLKEWNINGTKYNDGMIDLTITSPLTTATAVFGGNSNPSQIRESSVNTTFSYDESYVYLPSDIQGKADIYSTDGKQVKSMGVVGDKIGVYDLPQGAYILTLTTKDAVEIARFQKK